MEAKAGEACKENHLWRCLEMSRYSQLAKDPKKQGNQLIDASQLIGNYHTKCRGRKSHFLRKKGHKSALKEESGLSKVVLLWATEAQLSEEEALMGLAQEAPASLQNDLVLYIGI